MWTFSVPGIRPYQIHDDRPDVGGIIEGKLEHQSREIIRQANRAGCPIALCRRSVHVTIILTDHQEITSKARKLYWKWIIDVLARARLLYDDQPHSYDCGEMDVVIHRSEVPEMHFHLHDVHCRPLFYLGPEKPRE